MSIHGMQPDVCARTNCFRTGQALIERYDTVPGDPSIAEPSGDWIWLCDEHVREEFA